MQCCNNTRSLYLVEKIIDTNEIKHCLVQVANEQASLLAVEGSQQ